jgi:hypothetical protein
VVPTLNGQVFGPLISKFPFKGHLRCPPSIRSGLTCLLLSGLRTALGTSTTQVEVLRTAYNSSQRELKVLQ